MIHPDPKKRLSLKDIKKKLIEADQMENMSETEEEKVQDNQPSKKIKLS